MLKCAFMVSMSFSKVFIGSPSYCYGFQRNAATKPYYIKNQSTSENVFDMCYIANIPCMYIKKITYSSYVNMMISFTGALFMQNRPM